MAAFSDRLCLFLGLILALLVFRPAQASLVPPMTLEESEAICVGRVLDHRSRWQNDFRQRIVTEYRFRVEEALLPAGEVRPGAILSLPFWGGQVGGRFQKVAGMPLPEVGARYLLMLVPDWKHALFTPIVGERHGMYRLSGPGAAGEEILVGPEGALLWQTPDGGLFRPEELPEGIDAEPGARLHAFRRWLRAQLRAARSSERSEGAWIGGSDPWRPRSTPREARVVHSALRVNARTAVDVHAERGVHARSFAPPGRSHSLEPPSHGARSPEPGAARGARLAAGFVPAVAVAPRARALFDNLLRPPAYIQINQFPAGYPWAGEDQNAMVKWNHYGDIFRIYSNPTPVDDGSRRMGNGVSDLIGWWDDATLRAKTREQGRELHWGIGNAAKTITQGDVIVGRNVFREADIVFNYAASYTPRKDFLWTLADEELYDEKQVSGLHLVAFRHTMLHELGHVFGLEHQFGALSIMNYPPSRYTAFSHPYLYDAEALRGRFPSLAQHRAEPDLAIYLYRWISGVAEFDVDWREADFTREVRAGGELAVGGYHLENVGTVAVAAPKVEWYLTRTRSFGEPYYFLGTTTYPRLERNQQFRTDSVATTFTIPSVPAGEYHLAAFIRDDGGPTQASFPVSNHMAWSKSRLRVRP